MSVKTIDDLPWALVQLLSHWKNLDGKLAPGQIVLTGDYGRTEMVRDLESLNQLSESIAEMGRRHKLHTDELVRQRKDLKEALRYFVFSVKGLLMGTAYVAQLPRMPDLLAHEQPFMRPMEQAANLWGKINREPPAGFAAPLILANGLTQARFKEKLGHTREAFAKRAAAVADEREIRRRRERLAALLRDRAIQYHRVVNGSFPAAEEEVRELPRLWPPTVRKKKEEA